MKCLMEQDSKPNSRLMRHIELVSGELKGCALAVENLKSTKKSLDILAVYLGVTDVQAMLLVAILSQNFRQTRVSVDCLSELFGCSGIRVMEHLPDLVTLQKKRWIRSDSYANQKRAMLSHISFYVIREIFNRLMNGDGDLQPAVQKDMYMVLSEVMDLAVSFNYERITYFEMMEDVIELLDSHRELPYLKLLGQQELTEVEEFLFMLVCQHILTGDPDVDLDKVVQTVTGNAYKGVQLRKSILNEKNRLITQNLLKLQDAMFRTDNEVVLTDQAISMFLLEDADLLVKRTIHTDNLVRADSFKAMKLFFNAKEKQNMEQLQKLLTKKGLEDVVERLQEQNLRSGISILFHGTPGTGKTEAVYQLARKSGRDIMKVDLSQTKSMWFGGSEKKIKAIFNQYRVLMSYSERTPILMFNEADGVFGERRELKNSNTMQTFNTMQNILLEELENFDGILIATTNLKNNFDRAFERRFLFKIEFSNPDEETRSKIWRSKIHGLTARVTAELSQNFAMSGGQIENVTRKFLINKILYGDDVSYETLSSYCQEEQLAKQVHNTVGFKQIDKNRAS